MGNTCSPTPASIFDSRSYFCLRMQNRMELKFVDPVFKNGKELALLNETDVSSEVRRWKNAVVAYFVGHDSIHTPSPFDKLIDKLIVSQWRKYGDVTVYSQGSGVFVLDFETAQGKELALAEGPRFYDGSKPLILKPWSPYLSLEIKELKSAPVWIKLPNLRLHLWSPEALSKIASVVGKPLFTDTITVSRKTMCSARICVEVEFDKVLPDSVTIEVDKGCSYSQKVEYEWKPTSRCSHCLHIGHSNSCPKGKTTSSCLWCKISDPHHFCCKQSWPVRSGFGTTGATGANPQAYGAGTSSSTPPSGSISASPFGSTPGTSTSTPAFGSISAPPVGSTPFSIAAPEPFGAKFPLFGATSSSTPAFVSTDPWAFDANGSANVATSLSTATFGSTSQPTGASTIASSTTDSAFDTTPQSISLAFSRTSPSNEEMSTNGLAFDC